MNLLNSVQFLSAGKTNWDLLRPIFFTSIQQTLQMVGVTLLVGGLLGLVLGILLYGTRKGSLFSCPIVFQVLNFIVNFIRPIPFIIFLTGISPVTQTVMGTYIGTSAVIFPMCIMCTMATSRLVEQSLVDTSKDLLEAAASMGASKLKIITSVLLHENLAPLILGYTFLLVGVLDMSAMAGAVGGGGIGNFAIVYGYNRFNPVVTWTAVIVIIIFVQIVQQVGNYLAKKLLHK